MPRPYHNSLFSCSTDGSLLEACCCPCVVYGRNHSRIVHGNREDYSSCNPWCIAWCCLCCCGNWGWVLQIIDRKDMQKKHKLEGGTCGLCCTPLLCQCCELIQTGKELDYIQQLESVGYRAQPNMTTELRNREAL
ncbi:uncharacterized protein K444DRAFT_528752 [Hyaloscypha bicolor E]|uniref:PLAC8-domain-containing protein n=1 Tax=Hyaloscypha bicolor E TaxID=1095630 RepID=A0A2J6TB56_9HELO|nr:uncharacterized protein K444DRAFT_528752 [Hyaloscypha bicolor E]PMD60264.1 hypothetical protein K444DRAFT_528752 [Hyaloscypha bicolor E]